MVERHGEVVGVPAEAGVVEIDHVEARAVHDDVRRVQVGVDEAVDVGVLAGIEQDPVNAATQ